jgi:hypothetical protein
MSKVSLKFFSLLFFINFANSNFEQQMFPPVKIFGYLYIGKYLLPPRFELTNSYFGIL